MTLPETFPKIVTSHIILGMSAFLLTLLGTRLAILAARKRAAYLNPAVARSGHRLPAARSGGIAVVMALVIGLLGADVNLGIVLALFLLAAVSLLDEIIGVPRTIRLLVQVMTVCIPLSGAHPPIFHGIFPMWFDKCLTGLLWIWFINVFHTMDKMDGLSPTEMICIGTGLCLIVAIAGVFPNALSDYSLVVAASGCGFLWWNWYPAKILLGEVGCVPIGFLLGYLLFLAAIAGYGCAALILPAYYVSDSLAAFLNRTWKSKKLRLSHSDHFYQKALAGGWRRDAVARSIFGLNLLLILLATLSVTERAIAFVHVGIAYMAVFLVLGFFTQTDSTRPHDLP